MRMVFSKALISDMELGISMEVWISDSFTCIKAKERAEDNLKWQIENGKVCPLCSSLVTLLTESLVQKYIAIIGQNEIQLIKRI